jgi:hypothetical protein
MALSFAYQHEQLAWLVLDAFFASAKSFRLARSLYSVAGQQPYLQLLTRANKNYVGYFPAAPKPLGRPGPQATLGEKVFLNC